jgi:hypothetical protein
MEGGNEQIVSVLLLFYVGKGWPRGTELFFFWQAKPRTALWIMIEHVVWSGAPNNTYRRHLEHLQSCPPNGTGSSVWRTMSRPVFGMRVCRSLAATPKWVPQTLK